MNRGDRDSATRSILGDIPTHQHILSLPAFFPHDGSAVRPGTELIRELQSNPAHLQAFLELETPFLGTQESRIVRCNLFKHQGDALVKVGQYLEAGSMYLEAIAAIVGKDFKVPLRIDLMACCNAMGDCMVKQRNQEEALEWFEEVSVLYKNSLYGTGRALFDIFYELGNTSLAVDRRWLCQTTFSAPDIPAQVKIQSLSWIMPREKIDQVTRLRHPDPTLVPNWELKNPDLQVRGSWKKLSLRKPGGMTSRSGFSYFVWEGHLYIAGGEKNIHGPQYRDFWSLDLENLDSWRPLPSYPISEDITGKFVGWTMAVHGDKAYLFNGCLQVDFFDLITRTWGFIQTTYTGPGEWPYGPKSLCDYTMQMVDGHMYVFGGSQKTLPLGNNLFIKLNISTRQWTHLSGTVQPQADDSCPGPRRCTTSWTNATKDKIYLMYGEADRQGAKLRNQEHGASFGYGYDDLWTWSIPGERWTKEKIRGNPPCARAEMGTVYNSNLDKTIAFGGYSPSLPSLFKATQDFFGYTYYADTFVFDPRTSKWKQVLTRGFPTYRAQAQLVTNPANGKVFLFGGYTNTEFVPSRATNSSRSFADVWQLKLDMEGGFFEDVDLAEEARTARAGPWQRCFYCGSTGPWKKCGGTCNGRVFFCEPQCLKDGWKEHKTKHGCRKET
ncbi:hypothetical protein K439DRAFT_188605 [Ramaria rubella]|nr:hypothetical protein K439DRAFT_188605 [Ramaria rubella]